MADTQDIAKGGLHQRTGAVREPGLTGGVSRGDQAADMGKRPVTSAASMSPVSSVAHAGLALVFAATAVMLAVAPETVAEMVFGKSLTLIGHTEEAVKNVVGEAAHGNMYGMAEQAWKAVTNGRTRVLSFQMDFLLRLLSTGPFAACMILLTLQNAARQGKLSHPLYARLNLGLAASAASLLGLVWLKRYLLTWPAFMATAAMLAATLAVALPPFMQAGPGAVLSALPRDLRSPANRRAALYGAMAVLFFVEGLGIVPAPVLTLRAASGSRGGPVSHMLFQAVALSTHVLVPAAALCLKVLADRGRLTTTTSLLLNLALAGVGLQHVILLTRCALAGATGPVGPLLLMAWSTVLATAIYNMPLRMQGSE